MSSLFSFASVLRKWLVWRAVPKKRFVFIRDEILNDFA